jgi:hypothetical protein
VPDPRAVCSPMPLYMAAAPASGRRGAAGSARRNPRFEAGCVRGFVSGAWLEREIPRFEDDGLGKGDGVGVGLIFLARTD